jgi:hypothetical protein
MNGKDRLGFELYKNVKTESNKRRMDFNTTHNNFACYTK